MKQFFSVDENAYRGFSLFDGRHIMLIGLCVALILLLCFVYAKTKVSKRRVFIRILGSAILTCELIKDVQLLICGAFSVWFLPFHLCGIAVFLCFGHSFFGGDTLFNLLYSTCAPGALCAILFPDWTGLPPFCLKSLVSFLAHALITAYPLILIAGRSAKPDAKKLGKCFFILLCIALVVSIFNHYFDTNFMFLSRPSKGSPLEWFASFLGIPGYLMGYIPMVAVVWTALYVPFFIQNKKKKQ